MYNLATACGRSTTLTADHNLWVPREGRLQLIRPNAQPTDYMPVPRTLLAEGNLKYLDTLAALSGKRHSWKLRMLSQPTLESTEPILSSRQSATIGISGYDKLYAI